MINTVLIILGVIIFSIIIGVVTYFIMEALRPKKKEVYGGCSATRWGCCIDGFTPKYDPMGSNCILGS